jgi:glycosyltransferase involved in cell wall biosynthesis
MVLSANISAVGDAADAVLIIVENLPVLVDRRVWATNPTLKQQAVERGGIPPEGVWVVRSVPDLGRFRQVKPDPSVRRAFRYLVGYVGMIAEQDGVDLLVGAMEHIVKRLHRTDIACLIIGDGPEAGRLRTLTGELGIADNVEFAGYISGDALPPSWRLAISPSFRTCPMPPP